jgi:hypothetical protein
LLGQEARRVRRFESVQYRRFSEVVVVGDEDRAALTALDAELRVSVTAWTSSERCRTFDPG